MKILYIDTISNAEITVGLLIDDHKYFIKEEMGSKRAQVVLPLIDKILKEHDLGLKDLDRVKVEIGPGSFTGVRVGVSIANALGFALNIPVNGKMEPVEAIYE